MRSKLPLLAGLMLLVAANLSGSWKTDVSAQIEVGEFRAAGDSLQGIYKDLEAAEKPEACLLLAWLFHKQSERRLERRWLYEFFVGLEESAPDFSFLGISRDGEVTSYLNVWRMKYPRLNGAFIISRKGETSPGAPLLFELGLESPVEVLYKFSDESGPLRGGLLHRGRNLKTLGTFGFMATVRQNPVYLQYIPRTIAHARHNLTRYPELERLWRTLRRHVPELG